MKDTTIQKIKEYKNEYNKKTYKQYVIRFHKEKDKKLIKQLEKQSDKTNYIKGLIEKDI